MPALLKTTQIQEPSSATVNISLDSSGNVGIGTASPGFALDVATATARARVIPSTATNSAFFQSTNTGGSGYFGLDSSGGSLGGVAYALNVWHNSGYPILFGTNNQERMRIDSSGYMQGTVNGLSAGRIPAMQYFRLDSNLAGANVNTVQSVFGVGVTLVGSTQYAFEANYVFTKTAGTTSHTVGLGFGGTATLNNILYSSLNASNGAAPPFLDGSGALTGIFNTASNTTATGASTNATLTRAMIIKGTVSINAGGTFIPQYTLSAAPGGAYSTLAGSYFAIYPLAASGSNVSIGSWA